MQGKPVILGRGVGAVNIFTFLSVSSQIKIVFEISRHC